MNIETRDGQNKCNDGHNKCNNDGYKCNLCGKGYKLKDNFNKHYVSCKFFHNSCLETQDEFNDSIEQMPTNKELYRFIKEIAVKCCRLEEEVASLKQQLNIRQRKNIMEILNNDQDRIPFQVWVSQIRVSRENLDEVFEGSLLSGIKSVITPHLSGGRIPMRAFREKNALYIYDSDSQWKHAPPNCFEKMIKGIERGFLQIFLEWQKENQEKIAQSEKLKDEEIQYMMKICGYKYSGDKNAMIKKWITSMIEEDAPNVIIEYG